MHDGFEAIPAAERLETPLLGDDFHPPTNTENGKRFNLSRISAILNELKIGKVSITKEHPVSVSIRLVTTPELVFLDSVCMLKTNPRVVRGSFQLQQVLCIATLFCGSADRVQSGADA